MSSEHFPNDSKPFDIGARPFHRINSPHYDTGVDTDSRRIGDKRPPSGLARESGARGPDAFQDSGFLAKVTRLVGKLLKSMLALIPFVGPIILAVNAAIGKFTGFNPIDQLIAELGKLISSGVEGALFARYLRSIPSWVPVGRKGYADSYTYAEDGTARTTTSEEEREIEGVLVGSYVLPNDVVFTQWNHFRHWSFQVVPAPGFRYLVGRGNTPDPSEENFIAGRTSTDEPAPQNAEFERVIDIYGQTKRLADGSPGAIECLFDIGALCTPPNDGGAQGVMFDPAWPFWPMTGDHFWASGRWAYDCMRATPEGNTEIFPTQINPIKAFACARFGGVKFPENKHGVPTTKFLFFASEKGGYTDFHRSTDRFGKTHESGIQITDRDYEFVVDLPPHDEGKSPYAVGATTNFPLNRLVLRPRLLMQVRHLPFGISGRNTLADDLDLIRVIPRVDLLRPADPTKRPTQARITIPLKTLRDARNTSVHRTVGFELALGWHDPDGNDANKLFRVTTVIRNPQFFRQSGPVRLATAINGQWNMLARNVDNPNTEPQSNTFTPAPTGEIIHRVEQFLPAEAPLSVISNGTWRHGFGEFIEETALGARKLEVGGVLLGLPPGTKSRIKVFLDDARKTIRDIRKVADDIKNPKEVVRRELKKKLDALKQDPGADAATIKALEDQINSMVNNLPDTPDGMKAALDQLDQRFGQVLDSFDALEDFLSATDDLVGERFTPGWHEDIDAAVKTGVEESKRISAIARTMFLRPVPIFNKADEPMGWTEFIDNFHVNLGRRAINAFISQNGDRFANVADLVRNAPRDGTPLRVRMAASQFTMVGSGNNMAARILPPQHVTDYEFELNIFIAPQVPG